MLGHDSDVAVLLVLAHGQNDAKLNLILGETRARILGKYIDRFEPKKAIPLMGGQLALR